MENKTYKLARSVKQAKDEMKTNTAKLAAIAELLKECK